MFCESKFCMANDEMLIVLIVDDSELVMEKMICMLKELSNIKIVFQASSYAEAIIIIEEAEPDIVLMDIFLGNKVGMDLLKFLQAKYPSIEIGIISNHAGPHYRDICKKLGAHHFFDKSNDFELIPKMIGNRRSIEKNN